jgi:hypothetical protein
VCSSDLSDLVYDKRVIYRNEEGGVSILVPSSECTTIDRLIQDVPTGKPYQVLHVSEIPDDRTYRNAWTYEEA